MFGKMMNRFYYGKSGQGDYTKEDLPQTRMQLFWEMLRVRFAGLFKLNLLYMLAWIPAMIVIGRALLMWYTGIMNISQMQVQVELGELAAGELAQMYAQFQDGVKGLTLQTLLLLVPAIAITGPFTAGLSYVTRNWARDEHSFMLSDFREVAVKNWKQALLTSTITGFVPLLVYVCFNFYGELAKGQSWLFLIPQILVLMISMVWLCSLMYIYPQMVTYDLKYGQLVKNSTIMAIGRLPVTAGIKLLSLVPIAVFAAVGLLTPYMQYALLAMLLYYVLLGFALSRFVQASYANAVFDAYLNPNIEGAEVGRGLYVDTDDEQDDEEE